MKRATFLSNSGWWLGWGKGHQRKGHQELSLRRGWRPALRVRGKEKSEGGQGT